ncbi:MAG: PQQ-dependent sugar dehydrogenase [Thermoleophilia bacterium]|nr:PQQ-dependent sugar dehydrogenase [Thermoleophilia bacterium]
MSLCRPRRRRAALSLSAIVAAGGMSLGLVALAAVGPAAAGPPSGFSLRTLASGFSLPTAFAYRPDGRMLVAEKDGRVWVVDNGANQVFLDLRAEVNSVKDGGLLGLAVGASGEVYVFLTREVNPAAPDTVNRAEVIVAAYRPSAANPLRADAASRRVLVSGLEVTPVNHIGGGLRLDGQGRLLISLGDGATFKDVDPLALRSQDLDSLAGKLLRIDPATGDGVPDNPYHAAASPGSVRSRVMARGFRNPFRFGLDAQTGAVYVADVGWNDWEELDVVSPDGTNPDRDRNYGWPCWEGAGTGPAKQVGYATDPATAATCRSVYAPAEGGTGAGSAGPLVALSHAANEGGSITGGPMYRGTAYPARYRGAVFLADYSLDRFMLYRPQSGLEDFGTAGSWGNPVDIQVTPAGTVAYASISMGQIREIAYISSNNPPVAVAKAVPASGAAPLRTTLSAAGSADPDPGATLTYAWRFGDGSTATGPTVTHTYARGSYTATLTVKDQQGATATATVPVDSGNTRPSVTITVPRTTYRIGDAIPFTISATDAEDGAIPPAKITWAIVIHHLDHLHYDAGHTGAAGTVVSDQHGDNVHYEIRATATDSLRGSTTVATELLPETRDLALTSVPAGVQLVLDGQGRVTPHVRPSAIGQEHTLSAPPTVTVGGVQYVLRGIDTGAGLVAANRVAFTTPDSAQTVTARYGAASGPQQNPASAPRPTPAAPRLTRLRVTRAKGRIVISARVTGGSRAARLSVQARSGRRWRAVGAAALTGTSIRVSLRDRGFAAVRLRVRASASGSWRTARTVTLRRR